MRIIPRTIVGIEIAGQDVRIAVLRDIAGKRRLLRADVLEDFLRLSEEDRLGTLAGHFKRNRLSNFNVHLALPGVFGVTRDLEFPAAIGDGENLRSAVALQVENLSPWGLDEIYWDCAWEPAGNGSRAIVVHVGIVPRGVLDPWIALFRSAGLALTGASLSSLSWAHGVIALWGSARPTMVLVAENNYVEGALIRDGRLQSVSATGSDSARLAPASAAQLMRAGRIDSVDQVRLVARGAFAVDAGLEPLVLPLHGGAGAVSAFGAISTALLGLVRSSFRLNLIPRHLRYQRDYLRLLPTYALIVLLILLGGFALVREPYQQSVYAERLEREVQRLAPEARSLADHEAQLNKISDRLNALDGLLRTRDANLEALRELGRVLPKDTWLTSYHCQDNVMTIGGYSGSAASIQKLLEDSAVFRDAQFTSSIVRDLDKDRFNIRGSIEVRP
ncbi:MAG: PilN domain-containing protein [Acidobacteria bacterium]|nr:PilN domain-containing protein [Acidobacteriota bacterium]